MDEKKLREQLRKGLSWGEAHVAWKAAVAGVPAKLRGAKPEGVPHSLWELLEHTRIAQWDILEFSRNAKHVSPDFPEGYWPASAAPPNDAAWDKSVKDFERDTETFEKLVADPKTDLLTPIAHGSGQTILREALLAADHNAYHLGQFVLVRKMLGDWKGS
ncbi:MAG TPA: DinB family protein [Candidatus Limnocylindrales bacterium]|nr:DinB family protein [Candidatus Limnocylindrales bacterium]